MLFYEKLVADMRDTGFYLNPYGMCVDIKMIGCKKMMVFWHVDNLKVSYVDLQEVSKSIE